VTDNGTPPLSASQPFTVTVSAANAAPVITSTPVTTVQAGSPYSYTVTATDAAGQTLTYALTTAPAGMSINPTTHVISWTPTTAQVGTHNVAVQVTDNGTPPLSASQPFTVTVSAGNAAPVITSTPVTTATVGSPYSYTVTATDAAGQTLTYSLVAPVPTGMTINSSTGAISWTPSAAGSSSVTVRVTDNGTPALSATQTFTINVTAATPPGPGPEPPPPSTDPPPGSGELQGMELWVGKWFRVEISADEGVSMESLGLFGSDSETTGYLHIDNWDAANVVLDATFYQRDSETRLAYTTGMDLHVIPGSGDYKSFRFWVQFTDDGATAITAEMKAKLKKRNLRGAEFETVEGLQDRAELDDDDDEDSDNTANGLRMKGEMVKKMRKIPVQVRALQAASASSPGP
jgi:hypothetical protein